MSAPLYWCDGSGRVSLELTAAEARSAAHQGQCSADVAALAAAPHIRQQLADMDPSMVRALLDEYGAWDWTELASHADNLQRVLWLAACDIVEEQCAEG